MNDLEVLEQILKNQNEIKYFGYFLDYDDRTGLVKMELSASVITRSFKFKSLDLCLSKITDILRNLKRLEDFYLSKR